MKIFTSHQPLALFLLPLLAAVLWAVAIFSPPSLGDSRYAMPLYQLFYSILSGLPLLASLLAVVLIVIEAILLNHIVNEHQILSSRTYLPAVVYVILLSSQHQLLQLHPVIFSNLFLLLALNRTLNSWRADNAFSQVFDSSLCVGIASLFYWPALAFFFFQLIALIIFRPFNWREWVIPFMGVFLPYVFAGVYYFWFNQLDLFINTHLELLFMENFMVNPAIPEYIIASVLVLVGLFAFPHYMKEISINKVRIKKSLILMIWFFLIALALFVFIYSRSFIVLGFLGIPLAVYFANYILHARKKWLTELLFWTLIVAVILGNYQLL